MGFAVAVSGNTVVVGAPGKNIGGNTDQGSTYVFELFEAEPTATQTGCKSSGCRVPVTCNLPPGVGTRCRNRIKLFAFVRRGFVRMSDDTLAKAPRRIQFAFGISNIPAGETKNVRLRLTPRGREIAQSGKRRLRGVFEIRNTPGTLIGRTPVTIRLR